MSVPLSAARAAALKPKLDAFVAGTDEAARIAFDPVEFPRRYANPRDVEVAALISACLAYGRADLFKPKLAALFAQMGPSPAGFCVALDVAEAKALLGGFVYRFNVGTDLAVLLLGIGAALRAHGSLEALFLRGAGEDWHGALAAFVAAVRAGAPIKELRRAMGRERGLGHLLPSPLGPGAAKRLNLFLRWMVRGPDRVDLGIWREVSASALLIPLDTHIGRIARHLGLTARKDLSWRTAEEITGSLRRLDPADPIRYDFALCHYGMSGACPVKPVRENCRRCPLRSCCRVGRRLPAS